MWPTRSLCFLRTPSFAEREFFVELGEFALGFFQTSIDADDHDEREEAGGREEDVGKAEWWAVGEVIAPQEVVRRFGKDYARQAAAPKNQSDDELAFAVQPLFGVDNGFE